ncbi:hypothetical protein ABFT80_26665 [Mesorhizobium sp. SB112]|uniref:hypothetical protein n=1 Tax=Mesorhizobium sp. SB112 TaxID=3151853 RepID=UPI00326569CC
MSRFPAHPRTNCLAAPRRPSLRPSRRWVLAGLASAFIVPVAATRTGAQDAKDRPVYFVPAGRIGIRAPDELRPGPNRWSLLSSDHTMTVRVHEALRFGVEHDAHLWDKDDRSARVAPAPVIAGFEVRRFNDLRYGESPDYADETVVLRDDWWIGEVEASNSDHGGVSSHPGGQNARWASLREEILNAIVVRPRPAVADALAEIRVDLDVDGLNPRFIGQELVLSLYRPDDALAAWGSGYPVIRVSGFTTGLPVQAQLDEMLIDEQFAIASRLPHYRMLTSLSGRGLISDELAIIPGQYATKLTAFGRTRTLELTAHYDDANRKPLLAALQRLFRSMTVHGWQSVD